MESAITPAELIMTVNAAVEANAAVRPHGFKATMFDLTYMFDNGKTKEVWFFIDPIKGNRPKDVTFQAVYKEDGSIFFGVMGADWTDIGSDAEIACRVYENWDSAIDVEVQIENAK